MVNPVTEAIVRAIYALTDHHTGRIVLVYLPETPRQPEVVDARPGQTLLGLAAGERSHD